MKLKIMCLLCALLPAFETGCKSEAPAAAEDLTVSAKLSLINYQMNMANIVEGFLSGYRVEMRARADALAADALRAETKPDGTASVKNVQLIEAKRLEQYQQIEDVCAKVRQKFITANKDAENAITGMQGVEDYWKQTVNSAEVMQSSSAAGMELLKEYLAKRQQK